MATPVTVSRIYEAYPTGVQFVSVAAPVKIVGAVKDFGIGSGGGGPSGPIRPTSGFLYPRGDY